MGKSRTMGAGLAGSSLNQVNPNLNTSGGMKKQGLAYEIGVGPVNNDSIRSRAQGNKRDLVFYMNQVGGISPSLRNIVIRGVHKPSQENDQLDEIQIHEIKPQDIQSASIEQIKKWVILLLKNVRVRKLFKIYKGSFNNFNDLKQFLLQHLNHIQLLNSTTMGTPEDTALPSMSIGYGGLTWNDYGPCGGSRLYLCTTDYTGSTQSSSDVNVNYLNLDCTQNLTISSDINISTLRAGCVFTFYLVPMLTESNDSKYKMRYNGLPNDYNQPISSPINESLVANFAELTHDFDAEYGIGYRDAQSKAVNYITGDTNQIGGTGYTAPACIEIDLFEMTLCNVQTTLHGLMSDLTTIDAYGSYCNAWGSTGCYVGGTGPYQQTNHFSNTSNPPFGPGSSFKIDTTNTFNVSSTITVTGITLSLTTTISQIQTDNSTNTITLTPPPAIFNNSSSLVPDLSTMNLVSAIWAPGSNVTESSTGNLIYTPNATTWLDGIDIDANGINNIKSYAQGQTNPTPSVSNALTNVTFPNPDRISYQSYAYPMGNNLGGTSSVNNVTKTNSEIYGPIFARYQNMKIINTNVANISASNLTPCWSLDYKFRGMNQVPGYWHGFYGQSYFVTYAPEGSTSDNFISTYSSDLTSPSDFKSNVSDNLIYTLPAYPSNYYPEITGLGVTDQVQQNAMLEGGGYGYGISVVGTPTQSIADIDLMMNMNKYGYNYLATPDLITFSS